jgi:hypothetical protein
MKPRDNQNREAVTAIYDCCHRFAVLGAGYSDLRVYTRSYMLSPLRG